MNRYTAVVTLQLNAPSEENAKRMLRLVLRQVGNLTLNKDGFTWRLHAMIRNETDTETA